MSTILKKRNFKGPQGDTISPILFDMYVDPILRTLEKRDICYEVLDQKMQLMYADDYVLICDDPVKLQTGINLIKLICDNCGMKGNVKKSATMIFKNANIRDIRRHIKFHPTYNASRRHWLYEVAKEICFDTLFILTR